MEPKRPRRRPAPRSGRSIWRTLNSRPDGCAPTSASFTIPAIPNPGSLPCPNGRATCAPWTTARGGASSRCSRTSNRAVSALRTPRSASLTAWIASSWSWPSPSTGRSPQDSGMPSTMPLPAKKKRSRSTQESGPQPNLLVHQGPPPHRQDRPILPAAPAPLGGAAKLMDGKASRRSFLTGAVAAVAGTAAAGLSMPNIARAQTVTMRFQSTWPSRDIFHEFAQDYVNTVNSLSGGKLKLELLPAGAVVGALQLQDAIIAGALDGGHGVAGYWYGKNKAFSLFATPPSFGWNANQMLGWIRYGGGQALYDELVQDVLKLNLVGFLMAPMPTQPLGWFKKEIKTAEDMKNLKYRTNGLAADMNQELGAAVTIMGASDIVPAMDRGLLDGAEFNNPTSDRVLGFPDVSKVYTVQSYHQVSECFEVIYNKTKYDSLGKELQQVLKIAADAASADMVWKAMSRYPKDMQAIKDRGIKVYKTPDSVLQAQLKAWDAVVAKLSADPFFAKVIKSQKAWAKQVVGFEMEWEVPREPAFKHFFA